MTWTTLLILMAGAGVLCAALVPPVRRLAVTLGAVDVPDARRVHRTPIPRMGGLAVFASFMVILGGAQLSGVLSLAAGSPSVLAFVGGALMVVAVGAADDVFRLHPLVRLAVEAVAAIIVVYGGDCRITGISSLGGTLDLGQLGGPFTILWIVLVTNALNLIDGIDGLAAGAAAAALLAVSVIAYGFGLWTVSALAAILTGTCLGFLVFNFHPASVFLGDSGSLFIGFSLGVLSSYARAKGTTGAITVGTLLIVALPLSDIVASVTRRYFNGLAPTKLRSHLAGFARVFQADRGHLHHRLLRAGLGQRAAAYTLVGIQIIACVYAVYLLVRG